MEFSGNSVHPQGKLTLQSGCSLCQAIHMQPSVSGARKLLIRAIWDDRLFLVTWVVVDVKWPLIYEGHYILCCENLWKSVIVALEKPGKIRKIFSPTLLQPDSFFFFFVSYSTCKVCRLRDHFSLYSMEFSGVHTLTTESSPANSRCADPSLPKFDQLFTGLLSRPYPRTYFSYHINRKQTGVKTLSRHPVTEVKIIWAVLRTIPSKLGVRLQTLRYRQILWWGRHLQVIERKTNVVAHRSTGKPGIHARRRPSQTGRSSHASQWTHVAAAPPNNILRPKYARSSLVAVSTRLLIVGTVLRADQNHKTDAL